VFSSFGDPALNDAGQVAFTANLTGTSGAGGNTGIFLANGIDTIQVARRGQNLAGSTINLLLLADSTEEKGDERSGINNLGQVAYVAWLANGNEAVVRFTIPDAHWTSPASGSWNTNTNWSDGIRPNSFHATFIESDNDVQVTAPAGTFHAMSLTVGGGAGKAALRMQSGALLRIHDGSLTVAPRGVLTGGGAIDGDYAQQPGGGLEIELNGTSEDPVGALMITGSAELEGSLEVSLGGAFSFSIGDTFDILTAAGGVTGTFDDVTLPSFTPPGAGWHLRYDPSAVRLLVTYSADFDGDGDVDGDDLTVWDASFGINDGADADNDGDSDGADFLAWQRQLHSGAVEAAAGGVPEPSAFCLAIVAIGAHLARLLGRGRRDDFRSRYGAKGS
jgi:hypothetical protein